MRPRILYLRQREGGARVNKRSMEGVIKILVFDFSMSIYFIQYCKTLINIDVICY